MKPSVRHLFPSLSHLFNPTALVKKSTGFCDLPNGVACAETNPLRDRSVLLLRLRKLLLGSESLVALNDNRQRSFKDWFMTRLFLNEKSCIIALDNCRHTGILMDVESVGVVLGSNFPDDAPQVAIMPRVACCVGLPPSRANTNSVSFGRLFCQRRAKQPWSMGITVT